MVNSRLSGRNWGAVGRIALLLAGGLLTSTGARANFLANGNFDHPEIET